MLQLIPYLHQSSEKDSKFLILLPPGIPDPSLSCPTSGYDDRKRVKADHSTHCSSWCSAIDALRWHIGPIYMEAHARKRSWEERAVNLQRELSAIKTKKERTVKLFNFLNEEQQRRGDQEFKLPIQAHLEESLKIKDTDRAFNLLDRVTFQYYCARYNLSPATWKDERELRTTLDKGPILVFAKLGPRSYKKEPSLQETKCCGKPLWGWPRDAEKSSEIEEQAAIIAGIWITLKGTLVIYCIPSESQPTQEERKLYVVKYETFMTSLAPVEGIFGYTSDSIKVEDEAKMKQDQEAKRKELEARMRREPEIKSQLQLSSSEYY